MGVKLVAPGWSTLIVGGQGAVFLSASLPSAGGGSQTRGVPAACLRRAYRVGKVRSRWILNLAAQTSRRNKHYDRYNLAPFDYASASRAVGELEAAGIPHSDISIVASNADNWYATEGKGRTTTTRPGGARTTAKLDRDGNGADDRAEGAATGGGIGAALGGAAGVLAGLGLMAIPGVGPVVAAGWLAAMLTGAAAGGLAGGLIGALTQAGVRCSP